MPTDYSYLFQTPEGLVDARTVDLGTTFQSVQNQNQLNNSIALHNSITGGLGVLNGVNMMLGTSLPALRIRQTPGFDTSLNTMKVYGTMDYDNREQLMEDASYNNNLRQDITRVQSMNDAQRVGTALSSGISGALTLGQIAPGYGHVLGFLGGTAIGGAMGEAGKNNALNKTNVDNLSAGIARLDANLNRSVQADALADRNYRFNQSHVVRNGGQINTQNRQENIQQFANRVLGKKSNLPTRTYCKGGVMVKVKMK